MPEAYITLAQAAKLAPTRPSSNAVWRWCRKGTKARNGNRVRLQHVRVGGRVFTTEDYVQHFFAALAEADTEHFERDGVANTTPSTRSRSESQRKSAIDRAEAELAQAGI